jgi:DnaJ domain
MQQKNYYHILQVDANCNAEVIKKAYRKLALQYHPDVNKNDHSTSEKFRAIQEAYAILSNPEKRRKFHESFFFTTLQHAPTDIQEVLLNAQQIEKYINYSNIFKIDFVFIATNLQDLLQTNKHLIKNSSENLSTLVLEKKLITIIQALPFKYVQQFYVDITTLFPNTHEDYIQLVVQKKRTMLWEKYAVAIAILITLGLCTMIALLA